MDKIAIIGLGYVGLPLALQFARSGVTVTGIDVDPKKVSALSEARSYIRHIGHDQLKEQLDTGRFSATDDFSTISEVEAVVICVPTPLNKNREPNLEYVIKTVEQIAPHLPQGCLVVLESTSYPGTTDHDMRLALEKGTGKTAGKDFHLAFSPERENPGDPGSKVAAIPKIVGGLTPECADLAVKLYSQALEKVVPVSNCRVAEATKLLENIFRSVNIALVNELKIVYDAMGIDIWEVIEGAKTKPFGFMPFYPGPGLGGHCIPIDPFYLSWKAREYNEPTRFIALAGETNANMPRYVATRTAQALNKHRKPVNGSKVLIVGMAYKPNVDDMRESPSLDLMDLFAQQGADLAYYDPFIPEVPETRDHAQYAGMKSVEWSKESIQSYDVVVIATAHDDVNYEELADWAQLIVDTRNAFANTSRNGTLSSKLIKA